MVETKCIHIDVSSCKNAEKFAPSNQERSHDLLESYSADARSFALVNVVGNPRYLVIELIFVQQRSLHF
jgi:hypothetical protein